MTLAFSAWPLAATLPQQLGYDRHPSHAGFTPQVWRRYLRTWFAFDLLASLPIVLLLAFAPWTARGLGRWAPLRVLELLRLTKLPRLRSLVSHAAYARITQNLFFYLFTLHLTACVHQQVESGADPSAGQRPIRPPGFFGG